MSAGAPLTLGQIARTLGVALDGDPNLKVTGVAPLDMAGPDQISFLTDLKYLSLARGTRAAAVLVPRDAGLSGHLLRADNPRVALVGLLNLFGPARVPPGGIHASAQVAPSARVHATATVGALAIVGSHAVVGERTWISPQVYVGEYVEIGADCHLYPQVVICDGVKLGNRVLIHPGTVIGADGFGYVYDGARHLKIPQAGTVVIQDDVEIGANAAVDRATVGHTLIRRGTKIDNLVQIAHNVQIGEHAILAGQVGIAGSSRVGNGAMLGGQVGIADHVTLVDGVMIGAQSGVASDLKEPGQYMGTPARPAHETRRISAALGRLPALLQRVRALERRVKELEARLGLTPESSAEARGE